MISDFQVGMWLDNATAIPRIVDEIMEREPKVVLILGDYIYHTTDDHKSHMDTVVHYLKPLTDNGYLVYSVLGNHDYSLAKRDDPINYETAARVKSKLEEIGITVLKNESVPLTIENGKMKEVETSDKAFYLAGIGSLWAKEADIEKTFHSIPEEAPRFVMTHNPETFTRFPNHAAPVAVAGHTHGGQFRMPFTPQYSYMDLLESKTVHVDGWIKAEGNTANKLYVNRGVGFSLVPMRINCAPEITVFTLQTE